MIIRTIRKTLSPSGRGSIAILIVLLLGSAVLRLAVGAGEAHAQDGQLPTALANADAESENENDTTQSTSSETRNSSNSQPSIERSEIPALVQALSKREAAVREQEKRLEMRLKALALAGTEIEKRLNQLKRKEESLRATLALADEASENDLLKLTAVYENMKPKEAAQLFEEMEPKFAAGFLARMRPDTAAALLAGLTPEVAYSISVILAGRNANAPKT